MSVSELSKEIIKLEPSIQFVGISENSNTELNFKENAEKIDENVIKLSFSQTPHILEAGKRFSELGKLECIVFDYDKIRLFNLPDEKKIITVGTNKDIKNEEIIRKISNHIFSLEHRTDEIGSEIKDKDIIKVVKNEADNKFQDYLLNLIEFWKESVISSIRINEKVVTEFWKNFGNK